MAGVSKTALLKAGLSSDSTADLSSLERADGAPLGEVDVDALADEGHRSRVSAFGE